MKRAAASAGLVFSLLTAGCNWFGRAPKAQAPPPAPPPVAPAALPKPKPKVMEPPTLPPAQAPTVPEGKPPLPEVVKPQPQPPPAAKPAARTPRRRPASAPKPAVTEPPAPVTPPPAAPVDPPRLGELLDPDQRRQVQQTYDENQTAARQALAGLDKRQLTREQSEAVARVRSFLQQAEELQKTDLRTAAQLALRASQLVRDLLAGLK